MKWFRWREPARYRGGRLVRYGHDPVWPREPVLAGRHAVDDQPTEPIAAVPAAGYEVAEPS